jgi:hypothetical protein
MFPKKHGLWFKFLLDIIKIMIFQEVRLIATENPTFTTLATIYGIKKAEPI